MPWATREYVVIDGSEHLDTDPLTLNAPYPMTRSGFHKVTYLVAAKPDTDYGEFFAHWLDIHVPNVKATMEAVGGFRYVVSIQHRPRERALCRHGGVVLPRSEGFGSLARDHRSRRHGEVDRR